ncbi:hypothetical protein BCV71DRAFT_185438, partial [Rhizopus microsporus]
RARSLLNKVFVSVRSNANDPFSEKRHRGNEELLESLDVNGNTQCKDVNQCYISLQTNMCPVVLDYACLTTDQSDLKIFLEQNIEVIIFDNLPYSNSIKMFERKGTLNSPSSLDLINKSQMTLLITFILQNLIII